MGETRVLLSVARRRRDQTKEKTTRGKRRDVSAGFKYKFRIHHRLER